MNFTDDPSTAVQGVLWSTRGPWLVFRDAKLLKERKSTPIDGDVLIHADRVLFLQAT